MVPAVLFDLRDLCRKYLKTEPLIVGDPSLDMGMKANVEQPQSVGADRSPTPWPRMTATRVP